MRDSPMALRKLQQSLHAEVTVVATPQQLLDAVDGGARHIEIREHLDLTTVLPLSGPDPYAMLWRLETALSMSVLI